MPAAHDRRKSSSATAHHIDELLDEALKETFPASDPVAITIARQPLETLSSAETAPRVKHRV